MLAVKLCQFRKDRDAQTGCGIKFFSLQHILCGLRGLLTAMQFFTIRYTSRWRGGLLAAILSFTILYELTWRRKLITATRFSLIASSLKGSSGGIIRIL